MNRHTTTSNAPEVYDYRSGSYNAQPQWQSQQISQGQGYNSGGFGQPVAANIDPRYPVQPYEQTSIRGSGAYGQKGNLRGSSYQDYAKKKPYEYKYNIYSLIDESWNRCCEMGTPGTCPGNECIARRNPKLDWA